MRNNLHKILSTIFILVCAFTFASVNAAQTTATPEEKQLLQSIIAVKRSLPRYNLKGEPVSKNFDPTNMEYLESMLTLAIPSLVFVGVSLLVLVVYIFWQLFRVCFTALCGPECCHNVERSQKGCAANKGVQTGMKVAFFVLALAVAGGVVMGYMGNSRVQVSVGLTWNVLDVAAGKLISAAESIQESLVQAKGADLLQSSMDTITSQTGTLITQGKTAKSQMMGVRGQVDTYNNYRLFFINFALVLSAIAVVFGIVGFLKYQSAWFVTCVILGLFSMILVWLVFGIDLPLSVMIGDFCYASTSFAESGDPNPQVQFLLQCTGGPVGNNTATNSTDGPAAMVSTAKHNGVKKLENFGAEYGQNITQENMNSVDTSGWPQADRKKYAATVSAMNALNDAFAKLEELMKCGIIREAVRGMEYSVCLRMLEGLDLIIAGCAIIGVALAVNVIIAMIGRSHFNNNYIRLASMDPKDAEEAGFVETPNLRRAKRQSHAFEALKLDGDKNE